MNEIRRKTGRRTKNKSKTRKKRTHNVVAATINHNIRPFFGPRTGRNVETRRPLSSPAGILARNSGAVDSAAKEASRPFAGIPGGEYVTRAKGRRSTYLGCYGHGVIVGTRTPDGLT